MYYTMYMYTLQSSNNSNKTGSDIKAPGVKCLLLLRWFQHFDGAVSRCYRTQSPPRAWASLACHSSLWIGVARASVCTHNTQRTMCDYAMGHMLSCSEGVCECIIESYTPCHVLHKWIRYLVLYGFWWFLNTCRYKLYPHHKESWTKTHS